MVFDCSHACFTSSQILHPIWAHQNSIWEESVKIWEQSKQTWEHTVKSWEQPKHIWEHSVIIWLNSSIYEEDLHTYPRNMYIIWAMSVTFAIKPRKWVALWEDSVRREVFRVNVLDAFYPVIRFISGKDKFSHTTVSITTSGQRYRAVTRRSAILVFFFVCFFALLTYYALQVPIPPPLATYSCVSPPLLTFICYLLSSLDRPT